MAETTWQWGQWANNALLNATPTAPSSWSPTLPITAIEGGNDHSMALDSAGAVWCWGNNDVGQLGNGTTTGSPVTIPTKALIPPGLVITAIGEAFATSYAIDTTGALWYWGGAPGLGISTTRPMKLIGPGSWTQVVGGGSHVLLLNSSGAVYGWGANSYGQLGLGNTVCNYYPVALGSVFGGATVKSITAGQNHSGAIDSSNLIWMWGHNNFGQVGDGTTTDRPSPTLITPSAGKTCKVLSAGGSRTTVNGHTICILSDNSIWAWGANATSQLGDGGTTVQHSPENVTGNVGGGGQPATPVKQVYAGGDQTLLIDANNACWVVGDNSNGQSGNGGTAGTPATETAWVKPTGVSTTTVDLISTTADDVMCHQTA